MLRDIFQEAEILQCHSLEDAIPILSEDAAFDLILLDLKLPGVGGLAGLQAIREAAPDAKTVIFSGYYTQQDVLLSFQNGAAGFIPKSLGPKHLENAIKMVVGGDRYIPSDVLLDRNNVSRTSGAVLDASPSADLTKRQVQVLDQVIAGKTNKEIAREIGVEEVTVKLHVRHIFQKLGARNRADAVRIAMTHSAMR